MNKTEEAIGMEVAPPKPELLRLVEAIEEKSITIEELGRKSFNFSILLNYPIHHLDENDAVKSTSPSNYVEHLEKINSTLSNCISILDTVNMNFRDTIGN